MNLRSKIETALDAKIVSSSPLGVGFGLDGLHGRLDDGREIAVKSRSSNTSPAAGSGLDIEGFMLSELNTHSSLPVPKVYHSEPSLLIMSWIENDGSAISPAVERHAAELLADLHGIKFPSFGYRRDSLIGPLQQPNPLMDNWVDFFREHRLLYMAKAAHKHGALNAGYLDRIQRFCERLDDLLIEPAHPSLIHGDLWTGNVLVNGGPSSPHFSQCP